MKLIYIIALLLIISCNAPQKACLKDWVNKSKFVSIVDGRVKSDYIFTFNDSNYMEYSRDSLYAAAKVQWESCDKYSLIVQEIHDVYRDDVGQGDTLHVKIVNVTRDTVKCIASASGFSTKLMYLRIEKIK
ncbi:MAG TPA: hypothetical protein VHN59_09285 [Chitinophagaceae bacterium]|nr:hypothetical protein [Chitinophagaceae bacterium]